MPTPPPPEQPGGSPSYIALIQAIRGSDGRRGLEQRYVDVESEQARGGMEATREENVGHRQEVEVRACHAAGATAVDASHESKEAVEDTGDGHGDDAEGR